MAVQTVFECGACPGGYEAAGYTKKELEDQGWEFKAYKGGVFVLCAECVHEFNKRRALRAGA